MGQSSVFVILSSFGFQRGPTSMLYRSRRRGALILLAGTLAVAGCSNSSADPASTSAPAGAVSDPEPVITETEGATALPTAEDDSPSVGVSLAPAVKVGRAAQILDGVEVSVGTVKEQTVKASLPGEIAGPAAVVPVTVKNTSKQPFSLDGLAVTASYGDDVPGVDTSADPAKPLAGSLAAGASASGTYVFMVPSKSIKSLHLEISSDQSPKIVQFDR